jgi:hypothetical protein
MTLPFERTRAVLYTKQFLEELLSSQKTPRIPRSIRGQAKALLRHFPEACDIQRASSWAADVFGPVPGRHIASDEAVLSDFTFTIRYQLTEEKRNSDELIERLGASGFTDVQVGLGKPGALALQLTCAAGNGQAALFSTMQAFKESAPEATLIDITEHVVRVGAGIALRAT